MARLGFGLAALASLGLGVWFGIIENNSPGLSYALALIIMPLLIAVFGITKVEEDGVLQEGKTAAWISTFVAVIGTGYIVIVFASWLVPAVVWLGLQVPMVVFASASYSQDNRTPQSYGPPPDFTQVGKS